jgi:hypothetical protein
MCDLLTDPAIAELRKLTVMRRLENAFDELFNATPAADTNPCVDAVGGGTFEQGDAA